MSDVIYVTGHIHPDSDSICSAIAYANLLNLTGSEAIACRQGPLNEESKFILRRFHQENPLLLTDARAMIRDIHIDEPTLISKNATVHHAWHVMLRTQNRSLFVVDENNQLCGVCTNSNLSAYRLQQARDIEKLMATANLADISHTIGGDIAYEPPVFETNGCVHIITLEGEEARIFNLKDAICIISSGVERQRMVINNGAKCLILTCGIKADKDIIDLAKEKGCAIVETRDDSMHTAQAIMESYTIDKIMTKNVISFVNNEYVNDVAAKMTKSRVRSYPVLDEEGNIVGAISRYHTLNYQKRKFVLVDHSAKNQSINHVDDAEIQAIIDHHHIGDITTDYPINYRNVKCGCTCTIITGMYQENGIEPDQDMAGLLMSAILSDTLNLKSATTTDLDKNAVKYLAEIAGVTDIDAYATEMLGASVDLKESSPKDILYRDLKTYEIGKYKFAIGQTNYSHMEEVQMILPAFRDYIQKEQEEKHLDLLVMLFTHVAGEGSVFVHFGPLSYIISDTIETNFDEHTGFDSKIISRKQQLMPKISQLVKNL